MKKTIVVIVFLISAGANFASGRNYYVAPGGNDASPGDKTRPLATIARGAARLKPGDTLYLRAGRYQTPAVIRNLSGTEQEPITIAAYPREKVILDGTDHVRGPWTRVTPDSPQGKLIQRAQWKRMQGELYCAKLKSDAYALIYDGKLMTSARWPECTWDAEFRLDRSKVLRRASEESRIGEFYDAAPTRRAVEEASTWVDYDRDKYADLNKETLAQTGLDFTGGVVIMNHAWCNYAARITEHAAGENHFRWDKDFNGSKGLREEAIDFMHHHVRWDRPSVLSRSRHAGIHYMLEGLAALDRPEEWWYHKPTRTLYFISPDGKMPRPGKTRVKRRDYAITLKNCQHVVLKDFDFIGSAFLVSECRDTTVRDCTLKFSSYNKFALSNFDMPATARVVNSGSRGNSGFGNRVVNCAFSYLDGNALEVRSDGAVVDNILVYRTQYSCLGHDSRSISLDDCDLVRRVTINDVGASVGIKGQGETIYELNNIARFGGLQYDGSAIQSGGRDPMIYRYNWSHDHLKRSFRFDAGKYPEKPNLHGEMSYNVSWNTPGGYALKGNEHLFHNNILLSKGKGVMLFDLKVWASTNRNTFVANNAVTAFTTGNREQPKVLSIMKNNFVDDVASQLRDVENLDFRPKKNSKLVDAGYVVTARDVPWKKTPIAGEGKYVGKAPDIGAYEYGAKTYWIPGFRHPHASTPVPPDGSRTVRPDADLMFLGGYGAKSHVVYFGQSADKLARRAVLTGGNIFSPGELIPGQTYYWRVDAMGNGKVVKGNVWKFTVKE